jgi:hypothetical protein
MINIPRAFSDSWKIKKLDDLEYGVKVVRLSRVGCQAVG